nr:MAG TPA: hypothetical protein [Caudoviricetes sp.]
MADKHGIDIGGYLHTVFLEIFCMARLDKI